MPPRTVRTAGLWYGQGLDTIDVSPGSPSPLARLEGEGIDPYLERLRGLYGENRAVWRCWLDPRHPPATLTIVRHHNDDNFATAMVRALVALGLHDGGHLAPSGPSPFVCQSRWTCYGGAHDATTGLWSPARGITRLQGWCASCWQVLPARVQRGLVKTYHPQQGHTGACKAWLPWANEAARVICGE